MNMRKRRGCSCQGKRPLSTSGPPERSAVPAHEFGQRVDHDVGAVFDWPQHDRGRHRVVDDERHAVPLGDRRQRLDVADVAGRIADALAENAAGVVVDQLLDGVGLVEFGEKRTPIPCPGRTCPNNV